MNPPPRLMVVSQSFPPLVGGTANLLANLLRSYPGDAVAVAGYSHYRPEDSTFVPPCETVYLRPPKVRLLQLAYDRLQISRDVHANNCVPDNGNLPTTVEFRWFRFLPGKTRH